MDEVATHSPEFLAAIFRMRHRSYATCAVAILNRTGDGFLQRGTGTLFRIGLRSFVITASHVVVAGKLEKPLRLCIVGQSGIPVQLNGPAIVSHETGGADDDQADVAAVELNSGVVRALGESEFLHQVDVAPDDDCPPDYYFFTGFPTVWAKLDDQPDQGLELLTYCTQPYEGSTSSYWTYRPDWHILLRRGGGLHLSGERADMPSELNGISGCSIWRSYFVTSETEGQARVVAVQTMVYGKTQKVIRATRWSLVVKMLFDLYPDLRPAMSLRLPRDRAQVRHI